MSLFSSAPHQQHREKEIRLAAALDRLKSHFGSAAIRRGVSPLSQQRNPRSLQPEVFRPLVAKVI
jgi:hypothetical protein